MRKILILALVLSFAFLLAIPAFAHNAGPCNDLGGPGNSDYAQHHIRPQAQDGDIGEADHDGDGSAHNPGSHRGYSACS